MMVGTGLPAADIASSLDGRDHRGRITMVSRRGLRPRGHAPQAFPAEGDFVSNPARSATQLVTNVRRAVRHAIAEGRTWHPVLDGVRAQGQQIWNALETKLASLGVARTFQNLGLFSGLSTFDNIAAGLSFAVRSSIFEQIFGVGRARSEVAAVRRKTEQALDLLHLE